MTEARTKGFDVTETFVHLPDGGVAAPVPHTPTFWRELAEGERHYPGRFMTASRLTGDMGHWEMHPAGEELLISIDATADVFLEQADGDQTVALAPGAACIVPRGVWHRLTVQVPGVVVFITPGEGTQHKSR